MTNFLIRTSQDFSACSKSATLNLSKLLVDLCRWLSLCFHGHSIWYVLKFQDNKLFKRYSQGAVYKTRFSPKCQPFMQTRAVFGGKSCVTGEQKSVRKFKDKQVTCCTSCLDFLAVLNSLLFCFSVSALLEFNQSVIVSRKDPESRKRAVAKLIERLTSKGYWPQVGGSASGSGRFN